MIYSRERMRRVPRRWKILVPVAVVVMTVAGGLGAVAMLPASADVTPISQGKTATASSVENGGLSASAAVDGDGGTRWSSQFSDPQWLQVDLGATTSINRVVLQWERAYGQAFKIQVSDDATNWTDIYATTTGTGGTQTLDVTGSGRYVRMYGTARGTQWGYSLYEFQVFSGQTGATAPPTGAGGSPTAGSPTAGTPSAGTPSAGPGGTGGTIPAGPDVLLSTDRFAEASSIESKGTTANAADDNNPATRWSSQFSDPQWVQIDLGRTANIHKVVLQWENSYAKAFQLQVSDDALTWTTIYSTTTGTGGTQNLAVNGTGRYIRMYGTTRGTGYGYSLWNFEVWGVQAPDNGAGWVPADPVVTGTPSQATPAPTGFHEFQANCSVTRNLPDDPIVYFGQPGASHMHTFMGNTTTDANTTLASLQAGGTSCKVPGDKSGYWMPTMYNGNQVVMPIGPQVIYYKSGVIDYTSVRPFPPGLRFVVGSPKNTAKEFMDESEEGWECGDSYFNADVPELRPGDNLNVRFQAPSCWDGKHLDSPDHKSHMAYPVAGRCTAAHPIALPMLEFKMAFPAGTDTSQVRLSSGLSFSFHYDFFNAWEPAVLNALVTHCINGGLQCDARGYDETQPGKGAALTDQYLLP